MDRYTFIGWWNGITTYSWRIVGSHLFFLVVAAVICALTYQVTLSVPEGPNSLVTKATVVQAGAVVLGLFSIVLAALQVRVNATWNKVLSYHNHFGSLVTPEIIEKVSRVATRIGFLANIESESQIDDVTAAKILADPEADRVIGCYLDEFEELAGAINAGVVDNEYAYKLEGARILRVWKIYFLFIQQSRQGSELTRYAYKQLEFVAHRWGQRRKSDNAKADRRAQKERDRNVKNGATGSML